MERGGNWKKGVARILAGVTIFLSKGALDNPHSTYASQLNSYPQSLEIEQSENEIVNAQLYELINKKREQGSLLPLARWELLETAAKLRVEQMIETGRFSHYDENGQIPILKILQELGPRGRFVEMLGRTSASQLDEAANRLFNALLDSPDHKSWILWEEAKTVAVGAQRSPGDGFLYLVILLSDSEESSLIP